MPFPFRRSSEQSQGIDIISMSGMLARRSVEVGGGRVDDGAIAVVEKTGGSEDGGGHHGGREHVAAGKEVLDELRDSLDRITSRS